MAINSTNTHSRMVLEIKYSIQLELGAGWIPGHTGVPGYERADELARAGSASRLTGPEPFLPISNRAIQKELFNDLHSLQPSHYGRLPICSKGKIPLPIFLKKYRNTHKAN